MGQNERTPADSSTYGGIRSGRSKHVIAAAPLTSASSTRAASRRPHVEGLARPAHRPLLPRTQVQRRMRLLRRKRR
ncbi:hypothetical protein DUNSADRAFT_6412 [Dunaliella salina]|uniref:Encoded protein n=1 Tax=Dunaliella salina TaxID=3046 RepID=A0ABQ7H6T7_DUNSA|nr:hypothetical protein DUNSADRAFT_6412 [Dunaliella salina]|eukprot:KAF5842563.1 hypothetical protein DUNSADRAFT_6412 [Dunaliella salina]